ncbi:MAG: histidinol-phosphatase HisJ family protein [Luteolibacter sp.]|jgi:histidinol-phosphatase (PHP family)
MVLVHQSDFPEFYVMLADYHTHTPLCHHASGTPEAFVDAALAAGLGEFGISDHAPQTPEPYDDWRMAVADLPEYFDWIARARAHAAGRIPVRAGIECDWLPGNHAWIEELAGKYNWDYLIGSIHYLDGWDFDNPKWLNHWAEVDIENLWANYWQAYAEMAGTGLFDILGHPDLVKKFGFLPFEDPARYYEPAVEAIAASGAAIEINTAGWHKPCEEAYPAPEFLKLAAKAGIPLVISSDAHAPHDVARDFARAIALAKESGFTRTVLFDGRKRTSVPLPTS